MSDDYDRMSVELRHAADDLRDSHPGVANMLREVETSLRALRSEVERLTRDRDALNGLLICEKALWDDADARADAAEADAAAAREQVRKLREALDGLVNAPRMYGDMLPSRLWEAARAVLQGEGK